MRPVIPHPTTSPERSVGGDRAGSATAIVEADELEQGRRAEFGRAVERAQRAVAALLQGDPEPEKRLWSQREDVTLANPYGGFRRGWRDVEAGLDRAAEGFTKGGTCVFDEISRQAGADYGYVFEMERFESNLTDGRGVASGGLRVVMIFRVEDGEWKLVHRQADTLTEFGAQDDARHEPVHE